MMKGWRPALHPAVVSQAQVPIKRIKRRWSGSSARVCMQMR